MSSRKVRIGLSRVGVFDVTDWNAFDKTLDFESTIAAFQEEALREVMEDAAKESPKASGRMQKGFRAPDSVKLIQKSKGEVVIDLTNDVPYAGSVRVEGGKTYAEVAVEVPASDAAVDAAMDAIGQIIMRGR